MVPLATRVAAALVAVTCVPAFATIAVDAASEVDGVGTAASATARSERVLPPRRATIISDSAMAGVRWNGALPGLRGFNPDDRLESCRRLVDRSCTGREGRPPTVLVEIGLLATPLPDDVLIIATGYNDYDSRFAWHSRQVLDAAVAKGYQTIAWVTYREDVSYRLPRDTGRAVANYRNMNAELRALVASGEYPALTIWDLDDYTRAAGDVFASDGVHQRPYGSWLVADWLSRKMASMDGRRCPMPWTPDVPRDQVCPDPNSVLGERGYPAVGELYDL